MRKPLNNGLIGLLLFLLIAGCATGVKDRSFESLLEEVNQAEDATAKSALINQWVDGNTAPHYASDSIAYFIYVGKASKVAVAGDHNRWNPTGAELDRIPDTEMWYRKVRFDPKARIDYKLVVDEKQWILDPLNPNQIPGGFGSNSELAMPMYEQPWEIIENENAGKGSLDTLKIYSAIVERHYQVVVYVPSNYTNDSSYPVVYFQDGSDYLNVASTKTVLDNLIAQNAILPVIGIFVIPNDRNVEYAFDDRFKYADFFANELTKTIDSIYPTIKQAEGRAVIGDSYGGNISAIIAFTYPEKFGNCGIHSGAFQANEFQTNSIVMDGVKKDIRVASIWGSFEGGGLPANMHQVKNYLLDSDYDLYWKELPEGHSWGLWRATLDDMLTYFFPIN